MIRAPIQYLPGVWPYTESQDICRRLWNTLDWVRVGSTPRREYYCNDIPEPYTYGKGAGMRTYQVQPYTPTLLAIKSKVEDLVDCKLEALFLNGYENSRDWLGWHSDDSPEMDDERPIVIASFGSERDIEFSEKRKPDGSEGALNHQTHLLCSGSLCIMAPGMQDTHMHRIPKSGSYLIEPRVSLTFRGYKKLEPSDQLPLELP